MLMFLVAKLGIFRIQKEFSSPGLIQFHLEGNNK